MTQGDLHLRLTDDEEIETVENALEAVAEAEDKRLNTAGKPAEDELTRGQALVELAAAYTGWRERT